MDSGNNTSGSMQSSSGGGEEEYDSRAATDHQISTAFLTSSTNNNNNNNNNPLLFDPPNNNLSNFFTTNNNNLDNNIPWPNKPISDLIIQTQTRPNYPPPIQQTTVQQSPNDNVSVVVRNPKKRSRASRRAPTTVLTTDTSNFRAMVQEFTGIPAPPFNSSSSLPFGRTRLDIFGSGSGSTLLQRPFAHYRPLLHAPQSAFATNGFNSLLQPPPRFPALAGINAPFAAEGNGNSGGFSAVDHEGFLRSINGGDYVAGSERVLSVGNGKTTSDFHMSGGANNNVVSLARSEGMVESWICSSD